MSLPIVTIEFYGISRARAGRKDLVVSAATAAAALSEATRKCPALAGLLRPDGRLLPQYVLSLDGQRFITDFGHALRSGDRLLLLSADAGG
jgi:molybdopterin converting factor small subunit